MIEQILCGGNLADKLLGFGFPFSKAVENKKNFELPLLPGRVGKLANGLMKSETSSTLQNRFPKKSELKNATGRGRLLHFFANHELLAIETMAYALLKFPEAPLEFRKGVWGTLQDEQRHLGLYLKKMEDSGVTLGDFPLSLYFWKSLQSMQSPYDFVIRMSLTFEQANLDFALEYAHLFETEIPDPEAATLLRTVHDDEVRHVAHGLKWFQTWRNPEESEWESYRFALPFPLSPRRGKGKNFFSAESRMKAGFSQGFVDEMRIAGGSRGRVPDYYFFNPECEVESHHSELPVNLKQKLRELSPLMLWLALEEDVVELPEKPPLSWLKEMHDWKGALPEIITDIEQAQVYPAFHRFKPWGFGKSAWKHFDGLSKKTRGLPPGNQKQFETEWFSKAYWKETLGTQGHVLKSEAAFLAWKEVTEAEISSGIFDVQDEWILKSSVSTSGRGHLRFTAQSLQDPAFINKIKNRMRKEKEVVIEPFYHKLADFSTQLEMDPEGKVKVFEPRFFLVDESFQYQGALLGSWAQDLNYQKFAECIALHQGVLERAYAKVIEVLKAKAYHGPLGIDSMLAQNKNGELFVVPVIEVNVRYTMGRVAMEIENCIKKRRGKVKGLWLFSKSLNPGYSFLASPSVGQSQTAVYLGEAAEAELRKRASLIQI